LKEKKRETVIKKQVLNLHQVGNIKSIKEINKTLHQGTTAPKQYMLPTQGMKNSKISFF
jgi:hypothetical protein